MVRVYDASLRRHLAMKVLEPARARDREEVRRFVEEAQVTAQLEHPYIPAVHEMGVDEAGQHYFTMKLVQGRTLDALLDEPSTSLTETERQFALVQVFLKICEAVAFAHSRGVIHCDLKPANIMVGSHGQVYVMDWGIARLPVDRPQVDAPQNAATVSRATPRVEPRGKVLGTFGYLAPEQARGQHDRIDERSDVFSLGALLYRIVVGETIYPTAPMNEALARAMYAEVTPPERAAPSRSLPRRLCAIALKALALDKAQRHQTVEELRQEVQAWLRGVGRHPLRTFAAGEVILREGEPGQTAYIISKGRVEVFKLIHGRRQPLAEMGPGEIFGEAAIFTERGRTATVHTLEETTVVEVSRESLDEELAGTVVMGNLVRVLARRFHELDAQARTLRERVEDWALHATVMTHFALHGQSAQNGNREARWASLQQVLVEHLNVPEHRAAEWVNGLQGVRVDVSEDLVVLNPALQNKAALPSPTLPELALPTT